MLKSSGFHTLKILRALNVIEMFCFLLLKADTQANPWIFSDSAQASTVTSKNS
jgi:hypothetical protein